ncbi:MAG: hypothetical protein JEZ07_13945 [Phycisphaerae bacterium]|nr:hypothetical protein [Phycisphaerae bacterium]
MFGTLDGFVVAHKFGQEAKQLARDVDTLLQGKVDAPGARGGWQRLTC